MTDPNPNSADALLMPSGHRHVKPESDPTPPVPRFQRPVFPDGPKGPWIWPALEGARERHLAALDALAAAREAEDTEAEREALIEVCDAVLDGVHALRLTSRSAKVAYEAAIAQVKASLPVDEQGIIPHNERDRARQIQREAGEWTGPDKTTMRRCWSMSEGDTFLPGGSGAVVPRIVADVEAFRERLGEAADLEATVGEASVTEASEGDRGA